MEMEAFDPLSQLPGIRAKPGFFFNFDPFKNQIL
jgi:hypothetical protein